MKIAVFGAAGRQGSRIVAEAVNRGHRVTAVLRHPGGPHQIDRRAVLAAGDATRADSVAELAAGHEVLVSAVGARIGGPSVTVVHAAHALLAGMRAGGAKRLLVVGGAGSLRDRDGRLLLDDPDFPEVVKPYALAHAEALEIYRRDDTVDWVYVSPSDDLETGQRRGRYRLGTDDLLYDGDGVSHISMEDMAVAIVDEIERQGHRRQRITVGY
jgi:putative NADH-flavin reductase